MAVSPEVAEIIRRKKTQYCRFADLNQFHLFEKIALPTATFKFAGPDGELINENGIVYSWGDLQSFCTSFTKAFETQQVVHSVGPGEIEQVGPDEVKAIFTVIYHAGPKGTTDPKGHGTGGGHYHETWKRQGDDWFLADLWFRRIYWIVRD